MIPVDAQTMLEIAPRFSGRNGERQAAVTAAAGAVLATTLERYEVTTRLRLAHFLAQTCHESAGFRTTEEFATGDAYEGRADLGNTQKGDGRRFKGRGLLQLTGRANYARYGALLSLPLLADPVSAGDPVTSLLIACEYWKSRAINQACDNDDLITVTRKINGGTNGLEDRRGLTQKAKTAIARLEAVQLAAVQAGTRPVLRRGSGGGDVVALQESLRKLGFKLAIDGDFGAATELAITSLQASKGLLADGIVAETTWTALAG